MIKYRILDVREFLNFQFLKKHFCFRTALNNHIQIYINIEIGHLF